jgi:hypothetical protein
VDKEFSSFVEEAKRVLDRNWTGRYTIPSPTLYPHQWSWDSGFIAIGHSHYDQRRAQQEMLSLFEGQWKNGMLPHIIFNPNAQGYFPGPDIWRTEISGDAPEHVKTSGITHPPIHATAARWIYNNAEAKQEARKFLEAIYPKILRYHQYLYRVRDPEGEGLVYIRHPWESGQDDSPAWDVPLKNMDVRHEDVPPYHRVDVERVDENERPTDFDYDRYLYLIYLFRKFGYDEDKIYENSPFLVQDASFNAILCRSNEDLLGIAEIIGEDTRQIRGWVEKTKKAVNRKLWHQKHEIYDDYDLRAGKRIEDDATSNFLPLYAGIPSQEQADRLYQYLDSPAFRCLMIGHNCYAVSSYSRYKTSFNAEQYWRGPIWININWMLYEGLKRYGYEKKGEQFRNSVIYLPLRFGLYEYFDPNDGKGLGADNFAWTAALAIDMLYRSRMTIEHGPHCVCDRCAGIK